MRKWIRDTYTVREIEFDYDLHEFMVIQNDEIIATITPESLEKMEEIITALDNGECVDGWEDGMGNTINVGGEEVECAE